MNIDFPVHDGFSRARIMAAMRNLPESMPMSADVYFTRTAQVLDELERTTGFVPYVFTQDFVRRCPEGGGKAVAAHEIVATLERYTPFFENHGCVWAVPEGSRYQSCDSLNVIYGRYRDFCELETLGLGILSHEMRVANTGLTMYDFGEVERTVATLVGEMTVSPFGKRPLFDFSARHFPWWINSEIALAAKRGGAAGSSTPGATYAMGNHMASGTLPHSAGLAFALHYGIATGMIEATVLFDKVIDESVPRVTLPDLSNQEISETLATARRLEEQDSRLTASRLDTHGGSMAEGALENGYCDKAGQWREQGMCLPSDDEPCAKYWYGPGVTVTSAIAQRLGLKEASMADVQTFLTSGFAKPAKLNAFCKAEAWLNMQLFWGIGAGAFLPGFHATRDIFAGKNKDGQIVTIHKNGRPPRPNAALIPCAGEIPPGWENPYALLS